MTSPAKTTTYDSGKTALTNQLTNKTPKTAEKGLPRTSTPTGRVPVDRGQYPILGFGLHIWSCEILLDLHYRLG